MVAVSVGKKRELWVLLGMLAKTVWAVGLVAILMSCGGGERGYSYTISGTVSGLAGSGLILQNNGGDDRGISVNGAFSFAKPVHNGDAYAVTIKTPPSVFPQTCTVSNGSGTINDVPVYNVVVSCVTPQHPVTVHPSLEVAYAANVGGNTISVYTINPTTGALILPPLQTMAAGTNPYSVTVHPSLEVAYAANYSDSTISVYTINPTTGALILPPLQTIGAGTNPVSVTVDLSGTFAYVANVGNSVTNSTISVYTINPTTGALAFVQSVDVGAGTSPTSVTVHPSLGVVYVANVGNSVANSTISVYTINSTTGALILPLLQTVTAGTSPASVTVHPSGNFAYVANEGDNTIWVYTIAADGTLTAIQTISAGRSPTSVTVHPSGNFAYAANVGNNTIYVYTIAADGILTGVQAVATGTSPASVTVHPSLEFAYAANVGDNTISVYTIDPLSGALTVVP